MTKGIFIKTIMCLFMLTFCAQLGWGNIYDQLSFYTDDFDTLTMVAPDSVMYVHLYSTLPQEETAGAAGEPELPAFIYCYSLPRGEQIDSVSVTSKDSTLLI